MNGENVTYFGSFRVEHIKNEINKFIDNKYIITNIFRIIANNSTKCGYFRVGLIDFIFKDKSYKVLIYFLLKNLERMLK